MPQTATLELCHLCAGRRGCIKGWDARRMVKIKPQQPVGCEDFIKPSNEADRLLGAPPLIHFTGLRRIIRPLDNSTCRLPYESKDCRLLLAVRETNLNLVKRIADIHPGVVDHVVHVLDVADLVGCESSPAKSHEVHSCVGERVASAENIRREYPC